MTGPRVSCINVLYTHWLAAGDEQVEGHNREAHAKVEQKDRKEALLIGTESVNFGENIYRKIELNAIIQIYLVKSKIDENWKQVDLNSSRNEKIARITKLKF